MTATLTDTSRLPDPEPAMPAPEAVAAFLRAHPDFLAERPDLFRVLSPPRRFHGEALADHMSAMLAAERRRVRSLEAEVDAAVTAGRAGYGLTIRVRLAVLALMRSTDVIETVTQELPALHGSGVDAHSDYLSSRCCCRPRVGVPG